MVEVVFAEAGREHQELAAPVAIPDPVQARPDCPAVIRVTHVGDDIDVVVVDALEHVAAVGPHAHLDEGAVVPVADFLCHAGGGGPLNHRETLGPKVALEVGFGHPVPIDHELLHDFAVGEPLVVVGLWRRHFGDQGCGLGTKGRGQFAVKTVQTENHGVP